MPIQYSLLLLCLSPSLSLLSTLVPKPNAKGLGNRKKYTHVYIDSHMCSHIQFYNVSLGHFGCTINKTAAPRLCRPEIALGEKLNTAVANCSFNAVF